MFSKNLKYYRLKNKLSKKALAEMIKVTPMTITHYENGDRMPTAENLNALAGASLRKCSVSEPIATEVVA